MPFFVDISHYYSIAHLFVSLKTQISLAKHLKSEPNILYISLLIPTVLNSRNFLGFQRVSKFPNQNIRALFHSSRAFSLSFDKVFHISSLTYHRHISQRSASDKRKKQKVDFRSENLAMNGRSAFNLASKSCFKKSATLRSALETRFQIPSDLLR